MPGCGKSTVGVVLAKILGYDFLDSDLLIQKQLNNKLSNLIEIYGLEKFMKFEDDINSKIDVDRTVIATGGSVVYGRNAMEHFKNTGIIVYIKADLSTLTSRLGDLKKRGVVMSTDTTLSELYNERTPLYEKYAHITVECDGKEIRETVEEIAELLSNI